MFRFIVWRWRIIDGNDDKVEKIETFERGHQENAVSVTFFNDVLICANYL